MTTTPTFWNDLSKVNSATGAYGASIAPLTDGGYLVSWTDDSDDTGRGILGQRYNLLGHKVGGAIDLDHRAGNNSESALALLATGGVAVAFTTADAASGQVVVQRYNSALKSVGTDAIGAGNGPALAAFSDGGYVVAKTIADDGKVDAYFRTVSAMGVIGPDTIVASVANTLSALPDVAVLSNGDFVVVYEQVINGPQQDAGIQVQIRHRNGDTVLADTGVAGGHDNVVSEIDPRVAALKNGGFVVAWADEEGDQSGYGIRATIYTNSGSPLSALATNFQVDTTQTGDQKGPIITPLSDGTFIIGWADDEGHVVRGQRFAADGNTIGKEFTFSVAADDDNPGRAVELGDGRVAFGLGGDIEGGSGIHEQIVDPRNNPIVGGPDDDRLTGRIEGSTVKGLKGDDLLFGFAGKDTLKGGKGDDTLKAGKGADTLNGGNGADKLYAGKDDARDVFVFHKGDSGTGDGSVDRIFNFDPQGGNEKVHDVIDISHLHVTLKDIDLEYHKHSVTLLVDYHGSHKADMAIEVMKVSDLNPGDLLL